MLWVLLFLGGAVGGLAFDQVHVQTGTLTYAHPVLWGQPLWVGPQFGVAVVLMWLSAMPLARGLGPVRRRILVGDALWLAAIYVASGFVDGATVAAAIAFVAAWAVRMALRRQLAEVLMSVGLAIAGTLYEGTLTGTGAYHFAHPDLYHVPWWLPGLYLNGGPLAISLVRAVREGVSR